MRPKESSILEIVKREARKELGKNTRFHDFSHALAVYRNVEKIIKGEKAEKKALSRTSF
jgi:hypothetical protein